MDLEEAIHILIEARVHCGDWDVRTLELRRALHWLLEHHPKTKPLLVEFWHAVEFRNYELGHMKIIQSALAVPPLHGIEREAGWVPELWQNRQR